MKIILFGAEGMLGKALHERFRSSCEVIPVIRSECDLAETNKIIPFILKHKPDCVINSAALVDINLCEENKSYAFKINSLAVSEMANACNQIESKLIYISTDHYYTNSGCKKHNEDDPIALLNYYAYTKFAGEIYAQIANDHLILRTNIIGFKGAGEKKTFLEWAIEGICSKDPLRLFGDYFASSIDIYNFSDILCESIQRNLQGVYNLSSSEVVSKAQLVFLLAERLGVKINKPIYESITSQEGKLVNRANSLGLDVAKIEKALDREMPDVNGVLDKIMEVYCAAK